MVFLIIVMNAANQNQDSLRVEEKADGTFAISWDKNDPNYAFLNDLTEDQINAMLKSSFKDLIQDYDI